MTNLRDLTRDFFAGTLTGEEEGKRKLLNESCGCGGAPEADDAGGVDMTLPQFIDQDQMRLGAAPSACGGSDAPGGVIEDLDAIASGLHDQTGGCVAAVVSAIAQMNVPGGPDVAQLRELWNTLFDMAMDTGVEDEY
jgi:hypothetical protein